MGPTFPSEPPTVPDDAMVYVDAGPFSYDRLTGLSRYTARLTLALAARVPIGFFSEGFELMVPPDLKLVARSGSGGLVAQGLEGPATDARPGSGTLHGALLHDATAPQALSRSRSAFCTISARTRCRTLIWNRPARLSARSSKWPCRFPTWPSRFRTRPRPTPPGCRRWTPIGSWSLIRGRASASVGHGFEQAGPSQAPRRPGRFDPGTSQERPVSCWSGSRQSQALPPDAELWWVGPLGWMTSRRELKKLQGTGRRIRFLGVVNDARLCQLYQTAGWSIYPSLYEGFGFPVLDALRHGTPVLASGNSSIREFDSPGLHLFDPLRCVDPGRRLARLASRPARSRFPASRWIASTRGTTWRGSSWRLIGCRG